MLPTTQAFLESIRLTTKFGILDTSNDGTPGGAWLKFITDDFPAGLFSGRSSACNYASAEEAAIDLAKIITEVQSRSQSEREWADGLRIEPLPITEAVLQLKMRHRLRWLTPLQLQQAFGRDTIYDDSCSHGVRNYESELWLLAQLVVAGEIDEPVQQGVLA